LPFHLEELDAVVFGFRMSTEERRWFEEMLSRHYPHAELLEAVPAAGRLDLEIRSVAA